MDRLLVCNKKTNTLHGQLEYQDHGSDPTFPNGVAIHGVIPKTPVSEFASEIGADGVQTCAELDQFYLGQVPPDVLPSFTAFFGSYRPQVDGVDCNVTPDACGMFLVFAADNVPDCPKGDGILISLQGCLYDGYSNANCLAGGNLTLF